MTGEQIAPGYRMAVREDCGVWNWTVLREREVAVTGAAPALGLALGQAVFAAGAHAAFERIGRRRF